jgi:hypothetical protein
MRLLTRWPAWFCVALMLWAAAVESTHIHPTATESSSCSVCVVAHSANRTVSSSQIAPVFVAVSLLREDDVLAKARFDFSERGIRGPPVL